MNGCCLRFYIHENHRHNNKLAYEWLLEKAGELGVANGSVFRSIAGFRSGNDCHQDDLMDSVLDMTVMVEFILTDPDAASLIALARQVGLPVFFTRGAVEFGT